jgi:outer membrane protein OmpA-like peptidoglycan-associated protein
MIAACSLAASLALASASALAAPGGGGSASASASTDGDANASASADAEKQKPWIKRYLPERHMVELGLWIGPLFMSRRHELYDPGATTHSRFAVAAPDLGFRFGYYPLRWLGGELEAGLMPTKTDLDANALLYTVRGHFIGQLPFWRFAPFLVVGGGGMGVSSDAAAVGDDIDAVFHWGPGLKFFASRWVALRLDLRHLVSAREGYKDGAASHFEVLFGVSLTIRTQSKDGDQDGDGVKDSKDKCPSTPGDKPSGCPPDDRDGDGVKDGEDKCPDDPGNQPDGCPGDTDKDGVRDHEDRCPSVPGKEEDGCPPDKDKDGIFDDRDRCKNDPETRNGWEDDDGCPDDVPRKIRGASGTMAGIHFQTNSAKVTRSSQPALDEAAARLKANPDYDVEIVGHTDSTGPRDYNVELSEKRAASVRDYLVSKGVERDRISTRGAGPDDPIALNSTASGRAKNRRIEFKVKKADGDDGGKKKGRKR